MKPRTRWEQTTRFLDELPPWQALGSGVVVFFGLSMAVARLPPWGFAVGTVGITGLVGWLLLSGKPLVRVTWQPKPSEPEPAPDSLPTPAPQPATTAPMAPAEPAKPKPFTEPLTMVELPGGEFWMGSPENEEGRYPWEARHRVRVSPFAMAKYPVTQKLYQEVMEQSPSYFKGESLPVEQVSWFDAVRFCNKLSERAGLQPCYRIEEAEAQPEVEWDQSANGYRLPTEAEWEYACRAGTETAYSFGDDPELLGEHAWFDGNSEMRTHEVGTRKPNGWGLSDLHGNVWEWCWDWYEYQVTDYNDKSVSLVCPIGPPSGDGRVLRGGSFALDPRGLRSAYRRRGRPENRIQSRGFRCVRGSGRQS